MTHERITPTSRPEKEGVLAQEIKKAKYETGYEDVPEWDDVMERISLLNIPSNATERGIDTAAMFRDGTDIYHASLALHQVLVPGVESVPTDTPMKMLAPDGRVAKVLAAPEERAAIYDKAAEYIQDLASIYEPGKNDDEFLRRTANILQAAVVMTHSFPDGNGRTSRVLAELIQNGPEGGLDEPLVEGADGMLRFMAGNRSAPGRNPNRRDSAPDGIKPWGFIPNKDMTYDEIFAGAAALDVPLDDPAMYGKRAESVAVGMR